MIMPGPAAGGYQGWHSLSVEDLVETPPGFHVALDPDQWELIKGNSPQCHDGRVSMAIAGHRLDGDAYGDLLWRP